MGAFDDLVPQDRGAAPSTAPFDDIQAKPGFKPGDYMLGLKRGIEQIPGAITGLVDIPGALLLGDRYASKAANKLGDMTGFKPGQWADDTAQQLSPGAKAARQELDSAWKQSGADRIGNALLGNWQDVPKAWNDADLAAAGKAIVQNPGAAAMNVVESIPGMLVGGAIGKGLAMAGRIAPAIAGAAGEGVITAGQQMDQTDPATDPRKAALTAGAAGLGTGLIAGVGGKVAQKLGLEDIQTSMAGGHAEAAGRSAISRIGGGAAAEAGQEFLQSGQEQAWQNSAEDKPLGEGVIRGAIEGAIAGGVMGAGANLRPIPPKPAVVSRQDGLGDVVIDPSAGPISEAAAGHVNRQQSLILEAASAMPERDPVIGLPESGDPFSDLAPATVAPAAQMGDLFADLTPNGPQPIPADIAPEEADRLGRQNLAAWAGEAEPMPLTEAYAMIREARAAGATGHTIVEHPAGGGYAVVPREWLSGRQLEAVKGIQPVDNARSFAPPAAQQHELANQIRALPSVEQKALAKRLGVKGFVSFANAEEKILAEHPDSIRRALSGEIWNGKAWVEPAAVSPDQAALRANTAPTEAQKAAGNYQKGHVSIGPLDITIENPAGSTRAGTENGKAWQTTMQAHYGYIKRTKGADGDAVDVYVRPGTPADHPGPVFVVDQFDPTTGHFDEHKAMIGYSSAGEAADAYDAHFSDQSGPERRGPIIQMSAEAFKDWANNGDTTRPASATITSERIPPDDLFYSQAEDNFPAQPASADQGRAGHVPQVGAGAGEYSRPGQGTSRPRYGQAREGAVSVVGVHFSGQQRQTLNSAYYGTGIKGAEAARLQDLPEQYRYRTYFYVNEGQGVFPEAGVGAHAHEVELANLYDAKQDALGIAKGNRGDFNGFEQAVVQAGFDGYYIPSGFGRQGVAALIGPHSVPVAHKGTNYRGQEAEKAPTPVAETDAAKIAKSRTLPFGQMSGAEWKRTLSKVLPDVDVSHLKDDQLYYKDQLARFNRQGKAARIGRLDELIYGLAAEGRSSSEILNAVTKASKSAFNRQLARLLSAKGIEAKITIDDGKGWKIHAGPGKYAAAYSPKTNTVALFRPASAERHFLHEMMHAATLQALGKKGLAAGQMKALLLHVQKQLGKRGHYGLANVEEFVAEAFTNPVFQQALKQIPAAELSDSKLSSAWHWFVRIVRGILGLDAKDETALGQALKLGVELMQPVQEDRVEGEARGNMAERFRMPAPNGKPSNLTPQQWYQVRTPEFKSWFGDWEKDPENASKVVDENGEPLVVYHGTDKGTFTVFRTDAPIFTASTREMAASYPGTFRDMDLNASGPQKGVIPVFVNLRHPVRFDAQGKNYFELEKIEGEDFTDALAKQAKESGHDGVVFKDLIDDGGNLMLAGDLYDDVENPADVYVVFDSNQLKSATQNTGAFNPNDPDIRFNVEGDGNGRLTVKDWVTHQLTNQRSWALGALTRDQLADIYGKQMPEVAQFDRVVQEMDQARNIIAETADTIVERWRKLKSSEADTLADVMHEATLSQYDPDLGGEVSTPEQSDVKKAWQGLSDEAKQLYRDVRDTYQRTLVQLRNGLAKRAERAGSSGQRTANEIRLQFDKYLSEGPYFPLARFGDFVLIAKKAEEKIVETFESAAQREKRARQLRLKGWTTKLTAKKIYSAASDGPSGEFVGKVLKMVDGLELEAKEKAALMDDLNQLAISALPDQSYRRHFTHRKGTPGFSQDAMRAFASSMQHVSFHVARVLHGDELQLLIDGLNKRISEATGDADTTVMQQVANELAKRLDLMMNPNTHPVTAALGQVGFVMSLGGSIASGLTNLSQTPLVTFPWLGARFGFGKASAALTKASKDYFGGKWDRWSGFVLKDSKALTSDEQRALRQLEDAGLINLTQAHDLAGTANTDKASSQRSYAINRAMKIIGWTFHVPEVFNRQVSALAAYRLAREKGQSHDEALETARETLRRTHFDYSGSNRSRWMAGNFTRVVTMFKQYSQNVTYLLWRQTYLALKGETPEVRREARRMLLGVTAMHFGAAGALGLPLGVFGISPLLGLLAMGMGSDDEPWDWQTEFRNLLADSFGKTGGEAIAHGPLRTLLGIDMASRVGLGDLWVRTPQAEKEGRDLVEAWMLTLLGPVAGYAGNVGTAAKAFDEGKVGRGLEALLPKFIAAPLKAARYETEGVKSWRGDDLGVALHGNDLLATSIGFNPSTVAEMYEGRAAIKGKEAKLVARRDEIANMFVSAALAGDGEMQAEAMAAAMRFNRANPSMVISADSLHHSLQAKVRSQALIKDGVYLDKRRQDLRAEGRFANVQ